MAADLNADWNPYTSGPTFYSAPDGTTFDNQAALNAYMQGRLGQNRFMRGGQGGGGMPSGSGGGGSGLGGLYANAANSANAANESRYADILAGFDSMLGGGQPKKKTHSMGGHLGSSPVGAWRNSGTQMSFSEWRALQKKLEQMAASRGGAYGSIDATGVYPREWGGGQFLGDPRAAQGNNGGAYSQRPTMPPPVYPTYTPPVRPNQNY